MKIAYMSDVDISQPNGRGVNGRNQCSERRLIEGKLIGFCIISEK
jgi:hypothetical protein